MAKVERWIERISSVTGSESCCLRPCHNPIAYRCVEEHQSLTGGKMRYSNDYCVEHGRLWAKNRSVLTPDERERRRQDEQDFDDGRGHV